MRRKLSDLSAIKDIAKKEFFRKEINDAYFKGNICLVKINKVYKPWIVTDQGITDCLLNDNYKWLEIYPENENYAITAMYNDKDELIEWYFDMAKYVGIENGIPYIDDLYLDLVIKADGRTVILDEDELIMAYETHDITKEDLNLAYNTLKKLKQKHINNLAPLLDYTNNFFKMFKDI